MTAEDAADTLAVAMAAAVAEARAVMARGGPLSAAERVGAKRCADRLRELVVAARFLLADDGAAVAMIMGPVPPARC